MKQIGTSSLWTEKYRPKYLQDYICTDDVKLLIQKVIDSKDVPCFIFYGSGGTGKTSLAQVIANEIGSDLLYINGSLENGIDTIRHKVQQFAMTSSLMDDSKKLIVIDEAERMIAAQESLKVLVEQTESNARFIFCTNNLTKIIQPLQSRSQLIQFGTTKTKDLVLATFKRMCFILDNEGITYDKKVLAEITQKVFPDIRKLINELQKFSKMFGCIDEKILAASDDSQVVELISSMKSKKFNSVRKICTMIDPSQFYTLFYKDIDEHLKDSSKPNVILILADYANKHSATTDQELNLAACVTSIMLEGEIWK
jgi:DNA polymerase III delta prime subunit